MLKVSLSAPVFDKKEKNSAISAIKNLRLSQGANVKKFEKIFSKFVGTKYGVATNSGSSANLITLEALKEFYNLEDDIHAKYFLNEKINLRSPYSIPSKNDPYLEKINSLFKNILNVSIIEFKALIKQSIPEITPFYYEVSNLKIF